MRLSDLPSLALDLSSAASDLKEALKAKACINPTFVAKGTSKTEEEKRRKEMVKASHESNIE